MPLFPLNLLKLNSVILSSSENLFFQPKQPLESSSPSSSLFLLLFSLPFFWICPFNDLCRSHLFLCPAPSAATFSTALLLQPPFLLHSFCSHLFCLRDLPSESSSMCQSPTVASKSEVDSLWPLRMWHVARCDSDTWLKKWSAKTNREKMTHAQMGVYKYAPLR